jgi:hypothetical protein
VPEFQIPRKQLAFLAVNFQTSTALSKVAMEWCVSSKNLTMGLDPLSIVSVMRAFSWI